MSKASYHKCSQRGGRQGIEGGQGVTLQNGNWSSEMKLKGCTSLFDVDKRQKSHRKH